MLEFRYPLRSVCAAVALVGFACQVSEARDLIAFESPSCGPCKIFKREVLPVYAASPAGKVFPLWVAEMGGKVPFKLKEPVTFTPTFVWVDDGVEVGRFAGYFGKDKFFSVVNKAASAYNQKGGGAHKTALP